MDTRRPDRSGAGGLRVAVGGGDLIEDIHRQHRRRVLKRAAQLTALAVALLLLGIAFKVFADRRARSQALDAASQRFVGGTVQDLRDAAELLKRSLDDDPTHADTLGAHALARAHLWLEFGVGEAEAEAAVGAVDEDEVAGALGRAALAFADGSIDEAADLVAELDSEDSPLVESEFAWIRGLVSVATSGGDADAIGTAIGEVDAYLEEVPQSVAHRRLRSFMLLLAGDHDGSLQELERARDLSRTHMGLAADEALYNAYLHQELGGVASVADQLLESDAEGLSPRDRAHALLARGVVHVRSGEPSEGLERLEDAWGGLAGWNRMARELAIQSALEAGDASHVEEWVEQTGIGDPDAEIYRAWGTVVKGDVMAALEDLAELPQKHPLVSYLQALALVEQGRFAEAGPWLERTDKLLPGRNEVEVARARVELRVGDKKVALRKLKALAEEEPYAPRAWTGLGEAHLLQEEAERDSRGAKRAFEKAIDREPIAAEAMLQLAKVWDEGRKTDPEAERKALKLMERAAEANEYLPRYREHLGLYLAALGYDDRARRIMRDLVDTKGVTWATLIELIELEVRAAEKDVDYEHLLERAKELGADTFQLERERARVEAHEGSKASVQKAQNRLLALLQKRPKDIETRVMYAMTHLRQFDRKAAEAAVRKGYPITPSEQHGRLDLAWARIESRTGRAATAAPRARFGWGKMLAEDLPPRDLLDAAELCTKLNLRQGKDRVALRVSKALTDRLAFHSEAWTIRARSELGAGEPTAARTSAERAIDLDGENPRAHVIRGHSLLRRGDKKRAREAYERAVELTKGSPRAKEFRDYLRRL